MCCRTHNWHSGRHASWSSYCLLVSHPSIDFSSLGPTIDSLFLPTCCLNYTIVLRESWLVIGNATVTTCWNSRWLTALSTASVFAAETWRLSTTYVIAARKRIPIISYTFIELIAARSTCWTQQNQFHYMERFAWRMPNNGSLASTAIKNDMLCDYWWQSARNAVVNGH